MLAVRDHRDQQPAPVAAPVSTLALFSMHEESSGAPVADPPTVAGGADASRAARVNGQPPPAAAEPLDSTVGLLSDIRGAMGIAQATIAAESSDTRLVEQRAAAGGAAAERTGAQLGGIRFQEPRARPAAEQPAAPSGGIQFHAPTQAGASAIPWLPPPPPNSTPSRGTRSECAEGEVLPPAAVPIVPAAKPADAVEAASRSTDDADPSAADQLPQEGPLSSNGHVGAASREPPLLPDLVMSVPGLPRNTIDKGGPQLAAPDAGDAQLLNPHAKSPADQDRVRPAEQPSPAAASSAPAAVVLTDAHAATAGPSADAEAPVPSVSQAVTEGAAGLQAPPPPGQQAGAVSASRPAARSLFGGFLRSAAKAIAPPPPPAASPAAGEPQSLAQPVASTATIDRPAEARGLPRNSPSRSIDVSQASGAASDASASPAPIDGLAPVQPDATVGPSWANASGRSPARAPDDGRRDVAHLNTSGSPNRPDSGQSASGPQQRGMPEPPLPAAQVGMNAWLCPRRDPCHSRFTCESNRCECCSK